MIRKGLILIFLLIFFTQENFSQNKLPNHKHPKNHTVFINGHLASYKMISDNTQNIEKIELLETDENDMNKVPQNYKRNYTDRESLFSQKELNVKFNLDKKNNIYFDGYLIKNRNYKIFKEAIVDIDKVKPDSINELKTTVLNLWTREKKVRELFDSLIQKNNEKVKPLKGKLKCY